MLGMTQKELGIEIGYSESTADVRIAQYESGERSPGQDTIDGIAAVFGISPMALMVPDMTMNQTMHVLFALEDRLNFELAVYDDSIHLVFRESKVSTEVLYRMLCWMVKNGERRDPLIGGDFYDAWRYRYPSKYDNYPVAYDPEDEDLSDDTIEIVSD